MTISERLSELRRQKGATQEDVARALGVTNQAVSKWEIGACCPDIQLLPELCAYYGVSADYLLGVERENSYERVYEDIKQLFRDTPREDAYALAASLAGLLHEGCSTYGYRETTQWDVTRIRGLESDWGYSMRFELEGVTVRRAGTVLVSDSRREKPISLTAAREISAVLAELGNVDKLKAFFALYDSTVASRGNYATIQEISEKCRISPEALKPILDALPITERETDAEGYRLSGNYMHIAPMLKLLKPNC